MSEDVIVYISMGLIACCGAVVAWILWVRRHEDDW